MASDNQHLKHGKALCGKVFARFVETFNALVDFMCNVKGDADGKNGEGHIKIDRTNPSHPVIRCAGCGGTGGSVEGEDQYVITDVSLELKEDYDGTVKLVLMKTVKTVKVVKAAAGEEPEPEEAASIELKTVDAVIRSDYSTGDHALKNYTKTLTVLDASFEEKEAENPVFTAVAHSANT